jgi:hypothetical protein
MRTEKKKAYTCKCRLLDRPNLPLAHSPDVVLLIIPIRSVVDIARKAVPKSMESPLQLGEDEKVAQSLYMVMMVRLLLLIKRDSLGCHQGV